MNQDTRERDDASDGDEASLFFVASPKPNHRSRIAAAWARRRERQASRRRGRTLQFLRGEMSPATVRWRMSDRVSLFLVSVFFSFFPVLGVVAHEMWALGVGVFYLPLVYLFLAQAVNTYSASVQGGTLRLISKPLPDPLFTRDIPLDAQAAVVLEPTPSRGRTAYAVVLRQNGQAERILVSVDSLEEAIVLSMELASLVARRDQYRAQDADPS